MRLKLQEFYELYKDKPFVWGGWDCIIFAAKWVEFTSGRVIEMPTYKTALETRKFDLIEAIDNELVKTERPNYGDIVVFQQQNTMITTGIKMDKSILTIQDKGLVPVYFNYHLAWELPCLQ